MYLRMSFNKQSKVMEKPFVIFHAYACLFVMRIYKDKKIGALTSERDCMKRKEEKA